MLPATDASFKDKQEIVFSHFWQEKLFENDNRKLDINSMKYLFVIVKQFPSYAEWTI